MAKVRSYPINERGDIHYHFFCKGCGYCHAISPKKHSFNGDLIRPTFSPSLLQDCHSFIEDGNIRYLDDCWHKLKGQTIELPDIEG